jgi:Tfp pilus assembly protein PilV
LAEVVVAIGILASVLISVAGLLVLGNRQVASGRSSSEALAVARDVLEEMKSWSFRETTAAFADDCDLTGLACTIQSDTSATAAEWHRQLVDAVGQGRFEIIMESLDGDALGQTRSLRVTVTVHWEDGARSRSLRLATVRM